MFDNDSLNLLLLSKMHASAKKPQKKIFEFRMLKRIKRKRNFRVFKKKKKNFFKKLKIYKG